MRVIGMISGTSFDAIEAVAAELELDGQTLVADLRGHVSAEFPPELRAEIGASLPAREDDHRGGLPPRYGHRAAVRRGCSRARGDDVRRRGRADLLARPDGLPLGRGSPCARDPAARPAGVHRRADGCDRRRRRARTGRRRRRARRAAREPARRAPPRQRSRPRARLAQPGRDLERHRRRPRPRADRLRHRPGQRPDRRRRRCRDRRPGDLRRGRRPCSPRHGRRRAPRRVPRRAVLRARAAEVDRQGAVPPRLRAGARRRPRDRDRRPARDADRSSRPRPSPAT